MPAQLSKLHVRFIQTQKHFSLIRSEDESSQKLPLEQLYIKNNGSFYFVNLGDETRQHAFSLLFKEPNDYLKSLQCDVSANAIEKGSHEYEDALLFFHADASDVKQLLQLSIQSISDH
jgi:hypothetical protein